jgi:serine O-acetyltransferase
VHNESVVDFSLRAFLAADLRRARVLLHGDSENRSGVSLWLGIFSPRFIPILLCRLAYFFYTRKFGLLAKIVSLLNFFLFGIEIAVRCPIGRGLFLPHTQGTVIGAWSIGDNATIFQGVTLGAKELDFSYTEESRPKLGDGITIGSGAKVLGGLTLGDGVRVGANSVVLSSFTDSVLLVGAPARAVNMNGI